jgi:osmoprotectant transport system ATP-binding protein
MGGPADPMIRLTDVGKTYPDGTVAVHELSFDVPRGRTVVLVGPSGCGKSTTLKMVNRLIEPTTGTIWLEGEDVTHVDPVALRRRIGYVIQQVGLFPHQSIRANVATVPSLLGWGKARSSARADELLELVGLDPGQYAERYPAQLSGGQQQRVGVARALAADPPVLLMDEPFGAVDPIVRARLQDEFARISRELGKTVLFVTHDIDEAIRLGDQVAVFAAGGRLAQFDEPAQILGRPADDFVAEFVGASRGLRRLSVTPILREDLAPLDGQPPSSSVALPSSLEEALATLMRSDDDAVGVTDGSSGSRPIGVLTADGVHKALRRSIAESAAADEPSGR